MTTDRKKKTILVVDDEDPVRHLVCRALTKEGYDVIDSGSGPDAIVKLAQENFDAAILDIRMPEMTGFDLMHVMNRMCPGTVVIILTAMPDEDSRFESISKTAGVFAYLKKPCKLDELRDTLERAFAQQQASCDTLPTTDEEDAFSEETEIEEVPGDILLGTDEEDTFCEEIVTEEDADETPATRFGV